MTRTTHRLLGGLMLHVLQTGPEAYLWEIYRPGQPDYPCVIDGSHHYSPCASVVEAQVAALQCLINLEIAYGAALPLTWP